MMSFSEEFRTVTFELLETKPLSPFQVIGGKYFASLIVVFVALLPTLIYFFTIQQLSDAAGMDTGATIGSYIGLFFLAAVFVAIGICCSSITSNAVVAFITAAFSCFLIYSGFSAISHIPTFAAGLDYYIEMIGIDFHYRSMSRGVIDSRDVIYLLSLIYFFFLFTNRNLTKR